MDKAKKPRYYALDALRGLSLLLMLVHHLAIDLVMYDFIPSWLLNNMVVAVLQAIFASCFVALSGASSRFSTSNVRRGLKILLAAAVVSLATWGATQLLNDGNNLTVTFGILHFLGFASLIYHVAQPLLRKVPGPVWGVLFLITYPFLPTQADVPLWLSPFGLLAPGFFSADYYPILPWIFVYFFGVWIADCIKADRFPKGFYTFRCKPLEMVSRHSLWFYLLHQPVIMLGFQIYFALTA